MHSLCCIALDQAEEEFFEPAACWYHLGKFALGCHLATNDDNGAVAGHFHLAEDVATDQHGVAFA